MDAARWERRGSAECEALYKAEVPILAEWYDPETGAEVTLYTDGTIETSGSPPVEILPHVLGEWHLHLEGKIA